MRDLLLEPVRRVVRDLIDKRLWPVAAVLVAVIVALPLLITGSSNDAAAPAPFASAAPATPGASATAGDDDASVTRRKERAGTFRDPFFKPPKGSAASSSTSVQSSTESAQGDTTSAPAVRERRKAASPTPSAATTPASAASGFVYYRTVVRWNAADGGTPQPIARLKPLGGAAETAALFMGVTKADARYAVFVLGPDASSGGDAGCKPGTNCRMIGLKAGQSQLITVRPADGGATRTYSLHVESIRTVRRSATVVRQRRAQVHRYGRDAVRTMSRDPATALALAAARYDWISGLLRASSAAVVDKASK